MDTITLRELKHWAGEQTGPAISIYMPMHPSGEAGMQDPIRLKNLVTQAAARLEAQCLRTPDIQAFLAPAAELSDAEDFWRFRGRGLAILLKPGQFRAIRLPVAVPESLTVGPRLNIKPLVAAVDRGERFLLLALNQNRARLWEVTRDAITAVTAQGLPANMREALAIDSADRGEQIHAGMRGSLGKQAAIFHGQGGEKDTAKSDVKEFFRVIDRALAPVLRDETAPLLLAGVDYLLPIFREITRYPHLAERHLSGNCEQLTSHQLHERAWELMQPYFDRPRRQALDRLRELVGTDKTSLDPAAIVAAAHAGKIEVLLADPGGKRLGRFDAQLGKAITATADGDGEDLVNLAVAETLLHGGTAYPVEARDLPAQAPDAAIFRY